MRGVCDDTQRCWNIRLSILIVSIGVLKMEGLDRRCWVSAESARHRDDQRARELKESDGENREVVWYMGFGSGKQDTNIKYQLKFLFWRGDQIRVFSLPWLLLTYMPPYTDSVSPCPFFFFFSHGVFFSYILLPRYHRGLCTTEKQTAVIFRAAFVCTGPDDWTLTGWDEGPCC